MRVKALFFKYEREYPKVSSDKWEWYLFGNDPNKRAVQARALRSAKSCIDPNAQFTGSYQDSRPQLVQLSEDKYLLVWLGDIATRNDYNRTQLQYAVCENGVWSEVKSVTPDSGKADFYPELIQRQGNVYLAWQRANAEFTENDTLQTMAAAGEIMVAQFDTETDAFADVTELTNNAEMDLAPTFAVCENDTDPLTVVWSKNSENDMLGMSGTNSIACSSFVSGAWTQPRELYASENILSYISAAYKGGKLLVACTEDTDKDPLTSEDRTVNVIEENEVRYTDTEHVGNTQFAVVDNCAVLYYYKNGNVVATSDFAAIVPVLQSETGEFGLGFRVVAGANGTAIFYESNGQDGKQAFCAVQNAATGSWEKGIAISGANGYASGATGICKSNGELMFTYNVTDESEEYSAVCFGTKSFAYGLAVQAVDYAENLANGAPADLFVTVQNTGDFCIDSVTFTLFGQTQTVALDTPLQVRQSCICVLNVTLQLQSEPRTVLQAQAKRNGVAVASAQYEFFYGYADYGLSHELREVQGIQQVIVQIENATQYYGNAELNVYVNGEQEQSIKLENLCCNGSYMQTVVLPDLCVGDGVYIELVSAVPEKNIANNAICFISLRDSRKETPKKYNPYEEILQIAKGL